MAKNKPKRPASSPKEPNPPASASVSSSALSHVDTEGHPIRVGAIITDDFRVGDVGQVTEVREAAVVYRTLADGGGIYPAAKPAPEGWTYPKQVTVLADPLPPPQPTSPAPIKSAAEPEAAPPFSVRQAAIAVEEEQAVVRIIGDIRALFPMFTDQTRPHHDRYIAATAELFEALKQLAGDRAPKLINADARQRFYSGT